MNRTVNGDPNGVLIIEDSLYVHVARRPAARRMHAKAPPPPPPYGSLYRGITAALRDRTLQKEN